MINLEKAKEEFLKYTENYNLENERIKGKQQHSLRVMQISEQIAKGLNLVQEEIELAALIGLLHDIARFNQYTQHQTFRDFESFDHGDYALTILEKDIRKYIETDKYDKIIKKAIKNHNKYQIEDGLTQKEKLFSKIIRDADKIDIFYESAEIFWKGKENEVEASKISKEILEQIKNKVQIKKEKNRKLENIDEIILVIALIFDINFKPSFQIIKTENYINKILERYKMKDIETQEAIQQIKEVANKYLEEKIKESE